MPGGVLKIDVTDTIAFGDNTNDIPLLVNAGIGVAVGNATDLVKESADYVASSPRGKGFRESLKKFLQLSTWFCANFKIKIMLQKSPISVFSMPQCMVNVFSG